MLSKLLIVAVSLAIILSLFLIFSAQKYSGNIAIEKNESEVLTTIKEPASLTQQNIQAVKLPNATQYSLFEIIDVPAKNASISVVYFGKVPNLRATYYEVFYNGTRLTYENVTYLPKPNETIYLATISPVIKNYQELNIPQNISNKICLRQQYDPVSATTACILMPGITIDLLTSMIGQGIYLTVDFIGRLSSGLSMLYGEDISVDVINENGERFHSRVNDIITDANMPYGYKEYWFNGFEDKIIGKGSYAFILPSNTKPKYLYIYLSKTGLFSIFEKEREKPIALVKVE
jgi:hypothetical protein